jgi:hypothetical protein
MDSQLKRNIGGYRLKGDHEMETVDNTGNWLFMPRYYKCLSFDGDCVGAWWAGSTVKSERFLLQMKIKNPKLCLDLSLVEMWRNVLKYLHLQQSKNNAWLWRRRHYISPKHRKYPTEERLVPEDLSSATPLWEPQILETRIHVNCKLLFWRIHMLF